MKKIKPNYTSFNLRSLLPQITLLLITATIAGCDSDNNSADLAKAVSIESQSAQGSLIQSVTIIDGHKRLKAGETHQLSAVGLDSNNETRDITDELNWSSSDTSIATITNKGLVTAIANSTANQGIVVITGTTINGVFAEDEMSVSDAAATSIKLKQTSPKTDYIDTCLDATIEADVGYEDNYTSLNTVKNVSFSVDNTTTAKIDMDGNLYTSAAAIEKTTITAKIADISGQLTVTADPKKLNELNILLDDDITSLITLNVGDRIKINGEATLMPEASKNKVLINDTIAWSQENSDLTGITTTGENKGTIFALKPGVTQLTGTCGGKKATAALIVKGEANLDTLQINDGSDSITLAPFDSVELTLTANYSTTPAKLNVSEFSQWRINSNLLTAKLIATGTDKASYQLTSTSNINGVAVVSVTYEGITSNVIVNIE